MADAGIRRRVKAVHKHLDVRVGRNGKTQLVQTRGEQTEHATLVDEFDSCDHRVVAAAESTLHRMNHGLGQRAKRLDRVVRDSQERYDAAQLEDTTGRVNESLARSRRNRSHHTRVFLMQGFKRG